MGDIEVLEGQDDIWGTSDIETIEDPIDFQKVAEGAEGDIDENNPPISEEDIVNLEEEELIKSHQTLLAKKLIEEGYIVAEESEVENLNYDNIYEKFKETNQQKVKTEILSEVTNELKSAGITEENIYMLNAIQNGVPVNELQVIQQFERFSKLSDDVEDAIKLESVREMFVSRGFNEKEIKRQLDQIELDETVDDEFKTSKKYFGEIVLDYASEHTKIMEAKIEKDNIKRQANQLILDKALKEGTLGEGKLTPAQQKELGSFIYNKNISVDLGDGKPVLLSDFEKFLFDVHNDFTKQLEYYASIKWKDSQIEKAKMDAVSKDKSGHWDALKKAQSTDKSKVSIMKSLKEEGFTGDGVTIYGR